MAFHLNLDDIVRILENIKIAERHVASNYTSMTDAMGNTLNNLVPFGLRTVSGEYNNLVHTEYGSADLTMPRLLTPVFRPAESNPRSGAPTSYAQTSGSVYDSQPRVISNLVADQSANNSAVVIAALASMGNADPYGDAARYQQARQAAADANAALEALLDEGGEGGTDIAALQALLEAAQAQAATDALLADQAQTEALTAQADKDALGLDLAAAQQLLDDALLAVQQADAATTVAGSNYLLALTTHASTQAQNVIHLAARSDALAAMSTAFVVEVTASAALAAETALLQELNSSGTAEEIAAQQIIVAEKQQAYDGALLLTTAAVANFSQAVIDASASQQAFQSAVTTLAQAQADLLDAALAENAAEAELGVVQASMPAVQSAYDAASAQADTAQAAADAAQEVAAESAAASAQAQAALEAALDVGDLEQAQANVAQTQADLEALTEELGLTLTDNGTVVIPNVMPDLGDTAPFNSFLTLFGQFFDHGLDLVTKGGGTVYIPLQPDDPLYDPASPTNFMVLTRATNQPGPDGILGNEDDVREHQNQTTPFIDLNQVYTSHESHQVFLREYARVEIDGEMRTVATGQMLEGANGGPPTWADIKAQAIVMLGIALDDFAVHRVPLVATDMYGNFQPGADGYAQLVTAAGLGSGSAQAPVAASGAIASGHAFLHDIAHNANPGVVDHDRNPNTAPIATEADADEEVGNPIVPNEFGINTTYDDELLDKHYIVGDGRGNENIGLTAVHHVFHSEHNLRVDQIKDEILASNDVAFINEWLLAPVDAVPQAGDALVWNGERLFQASRFSTEMVYQHLVFEEFARLISPDIDPFLFSNTVDIDPAIVAEFAHVVYRFGHSMLTETVDRLAADGQTSNDLGLIDAFLNPIEFAASGDDPDAAAGAILRGMSRQVGNEIDEFLTDALRNNLVGLPLDLGAINLARGRDTGVPSLNEARRQFHEQTNDTGVKPYDSWFDFANSIKNPASIINFIAAYGTHESIAAATTVEEKREAATLLVMGGDGAPTDRLAFLNATGEWAGGSLGGLNNVDFWIGGLAEKKIAFGGQLGTTFNFVFEVQMEKLQEGDRFYYLSRTQGMNLLNQLEADSFAELVMRNTDLGQLGATHLSGSLFLTPAYILELNPALQRGADPEQTDPILNAISPMVIRRDTDGDGVDDYLQYTGGDHVVLGGTPGDDTLIASDGDDTLWGGAGNDRLEGGQGVDHIFGGDGDDIITDAGTDSGAADVIHGDAGNDVINGGNGLDLIFGGSGQDFIFGGVDGKTITAGEDNDFVRGPDGLSFIAGNEGDDWLEGGDSFDTLAGENSELFFNSPIIGHDVLNGRGNDTDYDAESGDDIMFQGLGIQRNNGMAGFDWAIHKGVGQAADSDLGIPIFVNQEANILRDRFDLVEGLSGWIHDDTLTGRDDVIGAYDEEANAAAQFNPNSKFESYANALLQTGVDRIAGLGALVEHLERVEFTVAGQTHTAVVFDIEAVQFNEDGSVRTLYDTPADILLGGAGSDVLQGKAGNDIIDGDRWLNVRIGIRDGDGQVVAWADDLGGQVYSNAGALLHNGRTLDNLLFDRTLNPGQLTIIREILDGDPNNTGIDTAVYRGNQAEYTITRNDDGSVTVTHDTPLTDALDDGTDRLFNIEQIQFADAMLSLKGPVVDLHALEVGNFRDEFGQVSYANSNGSALWASAWIEGGDRAANAVTSGEIRVTGGALQFRQDTGNGATAAGASITRAVDLSAVGEGTATLRFDYAELNLEANETLLVQYASNGDNFTTLQTLNGFSGTDEAILELPGPFTADAAIRFVFSGVNAGNETVRIDNVNIAFSIPVNDGNDWQNIFVEDAPAVAVSSLSAISNADLLSSAQVVVTNAKAGDTLTATTANGRPTTIAASTNLVNGQLVLTLSGFASAQEYQRAVDAVRFGNNSQAPDTTDRIIEVTAVDADGFAGTPAISTLQVVAVDDPMQANNDNVVTNVAANTPFSIRVADLLANDTDPDSAVGLSAITAQNSVAATLNAQTATIGVTDTGLAGGSFTYRGTGTDTALVSVTRDSAGVLDGSAGADIIIGNTGNSTIDGNGGRDVIYGGGGNDVFDYNALNDVPTVGIVTAANVGQLEVIKDWSTGDRIDLSTLDANALQNGNQAFTFIGNAAFTAGNQQGGVRAFQIQDASGQWFTIVEASNDNDAVAEFQLALEGQHALSAADFVL